MRAIFIKIVASSSLVLGLLGPQVASGSQIPLVTDKVSSGPKLIVVKSTPVKQTISQTSVLSDCGPVNSFLDRMDILIWQACGTVSVTDEFDLPTLAVVDEPVFVPRVVVQENEVNWVANGKLDKVKFLNEVGLIPVSPAISTVSKIVPGYNSSPDLSQSYFYVEDLQNSFTTVSMRC